MKKYSLRECFQYINADPKNGVRKYARKQGAISLRKDFSIVNPWPNRRIIHFSDWHIGMNHAHTPFLQVQNIVAGIIDYYKFERPKPIVMITGDLVDHYCPDHVNDALGLLQQLDGAGFTVLAIPGNHDYSDAVNSGTAMSSLQSPLSGLDPTGICETLDGLISILLGTEAVGDGYDPTLISGVSFDRDAYQAFVGAFSAYMHGGFFSDPVQQDDSGNYAGFHLDFILLDGQDHHCHRTTPSDGDNSWSLQVHERFYFHDNTRNGNAVTAGAGGSAVPDSDQSGIRFDLGWLEDHPKPDSSGNIAPAPDGLGSAEVGVGFFNRTVQQSRSGSSARIVAIHYPLSPGNKTKPRIDPWNHGNGNDNGHYLVNEPDLFNGLDDCHVYLTGHTHWRPKPDGNNKDYSSQDNGTENPGKNFKFGSGENANGKTQYYCIAGATFPDNKGENWASYDPNTGVETVSDAKLACRNWMELNIDLTSTPEALMLTVVARGSDGTSHSPYDLDGNNT